MFPIGEKCKNARKEAGISQETAAERLYISVTTLAAVERGERRPHAGLIGRMVDLYLNRMLGLQYLRYEADQEGHDLIPDVQERPLALSVMQLVNRIFEFADAHKDRALMRIAEDGVIDETERQEYDAIVADLGQIVQAALELRCR